MTTHTVRTIPHCKAGPIMCIECMARVANDTARRLGYSEHEANRVPDAYYEAALNTGDWRQCEALRRNVVGICRANDLSTVAFASLSFAEADFHKPEPIRIVGDIFVTPRIEGERVTVSAWASTKARIEYVFWFIAAVIWPLSDKHGHDFIYAKARNAELRGER